MSAPTRSRTAEQLWQEYTRYGCVTARAVPPLTRILFIVTVAVVPGVALLTLLLAVLMAYSGDGLAWLVTLWIGLAVCAVGVGVALLLWWRMHTVLGATWMLTPQGIIVDGVGPVPWGDLEPSQYRMERAAHQDGREQALVMPLTPAGQQRATALNGAQRATLNKGASGTVWGPKPLESIRLVAMRGIPTAQWRAFLDGLHQQQTSQGPTGPQQQYNAHQQ